MKSRALIGKYGEGHNDYAEIKMCSHTGAISAIDPEEHSVHDGEAYLCSAGQTVSDTNDRTAIAIKTPLSRKHLHLVASAQSGAGSWFYIREGPTITDGQGATLAVYNRNRNSVNTSGVIDTSATPDLVGSATYFAEADQADYTENGSLIYQELLSSGDKSRGGAATWGREGFICKPDTVYLFYLKATSDLDCVQNINLGWFEHTETY